MKVTIILPQYIKEFLDIEADRVKLSEIDLDNKTLLIHDKIENRVDSHVIYFGDIMLDVEIKGDDE